MAVPPPPADPNRADKRALRARLRAERDAFVTQRPPPVLVPDAFRSRLAPGKVVAAYVAIGGEADPAPLVDAARAAGCTIALPHVTSRALPLAFLEWRSDTPLVPGPFGLSQPPADARACDPDVILTPLVGFDAGLNRLGQGAGHYDRAFGRWPDALRIGIAWSMQACPPLPVDPWDMPLDGVATETAWHAR